jgi:tryptophanyl-tRNA synthetase
MKKRLLTGDRPTGRLHLGHYVGTLENRLALQDEFETYLLVADYHILTTNVDHLPDIKSNVIEVVKDNLSVGIDPKKVTYYLQSDVPEVAELSLLFGMLVQVPRLELIPTLKDQIKTTGQNAPSYGLLGYPVLQSADILLVRGEVVPVGKDQESHVELTREIASRFNRLYGQTFPEPKAMLGRVGTLPGVDGQEKMGKSLGNAIYLSDISSEVKRKVMNMYTDPKRIHANDPGTVEGNPVFTYHEAFNSNLDQVNDLKKRYQAGQVGDVEVKEKLYLALEEFLIPIRERRSKIKDQDVEEILSDGAKKVRLIARETVGDARAAMKIPRLPE